jgi:AbrB family looped-hinge helix DNA binding protein
MQVKNVAQVQINVKNITINLRRIEKMDMARVSMKGQVTIPIEIRRKLGLREGDKVVFLEQGENIILLNSNRIAWKELQTSFQGAAEEAGFKSEDDVIDFCRNIRQEMWEERDGRDD